jgi:Zn-dependent M28 family amino/carboxypeptidase
MRLAKLQIDAGPRTAGSPALRRVAARLRALLPNGRFEALPADPGMRNVVGELPGTGPVIVLGAHYETINRPKGFVGANDAAAAVGAVVEIARALQHVRRPAGAPAIRFVLFDGEEELAPTDNFYRDALRGSKAYVQAHAEEVRAMILLDYIGNPGLQLPREATSDRGLWTGMRAAAGRVGVASVFPDTIGQSIFDDHTPFLRAGIPAVDVIDWNWPYQHRLSDTYDKLSERSVDAVGETVVELLRTWR